MKHMLYILSMFVIITIYTGLKEDLALLSKEEQQEVQRWPEELQRLLGVGARINHHEISLYDPPEELKTVVPEYNEVMHKVRCDTANRTNDTSTLMRVDEVATKLEAALELYLANKKNN